MKPKAPALERAVDWAMSIRRFVWLPAFLLLSGCAPYIGTCGWIVPEAGDALKVVAERKPISNECNCLDCSAPGQFAIRRADYTLEFWNGDRWYPEMYVRARAPDGATLDLTADSPELLRIAPHVPAASTHGFEFFMRFPSEEGETATVKSLSIRVLAPDGRVLGTEVVGLRPEFRKDFSVESI